MSMLLIDDKAKADIAKTIKYAEENKISKAFMLERSKGKKVLAIGDNPSHVCNLLSNFRVVFSIEEQPFGWTKHISISIESQNLPNEIAVEMIMKEFGMEKPIKDCIVYIENSFPKSINVISKI